MARRKKNKSISSNAHLYNISESYTLPGGRVIENGEVIKIIGEHGVKFRFKCHVVRTDTNVEWIDCFELEKGINAKHRSFRPDRVKPLPKSRRPRKMTA